MKNIDEAGVEWHLLHPDADKEETWKAGANYVLEEIDSLMKDVSDGYPRFQQGTIIHGRLIKLLEQLKK